MDKKMVLKRLVMMMILSMFVVVISVGDVSATKLYLTPTNNLSEINSESNTWKAFDTGESYIWDNYQLKEKIQGTQYKYHIWAAGTHEVIGCKSPFIFGSCNGGYVPNYAPWADFKGEIIINEKIAATFNCTARWDIFAVGYLTTGKPFELGSYAQCDAPVSGSNIEALPGDDVKLKMTVVDQYLHGNYGTVYYGGIFDSWIEIPDNPTPTSTPTPTPTSTPTPNMTIIDYYKSLGTNKSIVETTDLLKAADDWSNNRTIDGFTLPITTQQLLSLADEWSRS
jgi:hypothetical protein